LLNSLYLARMWPCGTGPQRYWGPSITYTWRRNFLSPCVHSHLMGIVSNTYKSSTSLHVSGVLVNTQNLICHQGKRRERHVPSQGTGFIQGNGTAPGLFGVFCLVAPGDW
jgi:hypothetical protein